MNFDLLGRKRAQVSENSAQLVSDWSRDRNLRYQSLRRKLQAAIAAEAALDGGETEELLEILDEMEKQGELPEDLRDLQSVARAVLS